MNINKKLAKQKCKLFATVAVALLALSVSIFLCFSLMILQNQRNLSYSQASRNFESYVGSTLYNVYRRDLINYFFNLDYDDNIYMVVSDSKTGEIVAERKNALSFNSKDYSTSEKRNLMAVIDYEDFRKSMTDEQYNKISKYLSTEESSNKEHMLFCSEYYYNGVEILPKVVEVVLVENQGKDVLTEIERYNLIEKVETFELNPKYASTDEYHKIKDINDNYTDGNNYIKNEFFFGEYERENLIEQIEGIESYVDEDIASTVDANGEIYPISFFEFIYYQTEEFNIPTENETYYFNATFVQKVNVLDSCINDIIMMFFYVIILFGTTGGIIAVVTWKTLKKQIEQENRLRTVTNAMAHELKTPLFIIGGYAENLAEDVNTDKRTHYAQVITEQINSMNEMVCKMLDYSKLDSESFNLNIERFELTALVKEICDSYNLDASQVDCKDGVFIEADKRLIKSVAENLIENAVKYTADFSKISVKLKNGRFSVQNPYREVSKQEIEDMWKPYYRSTEQEKSNGHGLGLAIVKNILDLHSFKSRTSYSNGNIIFSFEFK